MTTTTAETEYPYTTAALAAEFQVTNKTLRKRAAALSLGLDFEGRAGFRYSEADRQKLIESLRPPAPEPDHRPQRGKRIAAAAP